jgi:hypothetical protein
MADPWGNESSSTRTPEPTDDFGRIAKYINTINVAIKELDRLVNEIGTSKDGKKLRYSVL